MSSTAFCLPWFLVKNWLLILLRVPCLWTFLLSCYFHVSEFFWKVDWMCLCVDLFECIPLRGIWSFLDMLICAFFFKVRKFSAFMSSDILSPFISISFLSEAPTIYMLVHLMVSYKSLRFYSFLFFIVSYCSSDLVISTDLFKFADISSACSNLLLNLSHEFFILVILLWAQNFILLHFIISLFINIPYFVRLYPLSFLYFIVSGFL